MKNQNTQHTPGPWRFDGKIVSAKNQPNVCRLENGHLIAAAPDLLAALYASKMALLSCMHANVLVDTAFDQVNAAIARATGKEGAK